MKDEAKQNLELVSSMDQTLYGTEYRNHILEQYKICVQMADNISNRRHMTNTFFLTINTGIVSALGIAGYMDPDKSQINKDYIIFLVFGLWVFCYMWYQLIKSYRDLNSAKFKVINEIEKILPLRPFDTEWGVLSRGRDRRVYRPFAKTERLVPVVFSALYLLLVAYVYLFK